MYGSGGEFVAGGVAPQRCFWWWRRRTDLFTAGPIRRQAFDRQLRCAPLPRTFRIQVPFRDGQQLLSDRGHRRDG